MRRHYIAQQCTTIAGTIIAAHKIRIICIHKNRRQRTVFEFRSSSVLFIGLRYLLRLIVSTYRAEFIADAVRDVD